MHIFLFVFLSFSYFKILDVYEIFPQCGHNFCCRSYPSKSSPSKCPLEATSAQVGPDRANGVHSIPDPTGEEVSFLPGRRAESHGVCLRPTSTVGTDSARLGTAFLGLAAEKSVICVQIWPFMPRGQNTNDFKGEVGGFPEKTAAK